MLTATLDGVHSVKAASYHSLPIAGICGGKRRCHSKVQPLDRQEIAFEEVRGYLAPASILSYLFDGHVS